MTRPGLQFLTFTFSISDEKKKIDCPLPMMLSGLSLEPWWMSSGSQMWRGQRACALVRNSRGHSLPLSSALKPVSIASCCQAEQYCVVGSERGTVLFNYLEITAFSCLETRQRAGNKEMIQATCPLWFLKTKWRPQNVYPWSGEKIFFSLFNKESG